MSITLASHRASWGRRFVSGLVSLGRSHSIARLSDAHLSDIGARDTGSLVDIGMSRIVARTPFPFC